MKPVKTEIRFESLLQDASAFPKNSILIYDNVFTARNDGPFAQFSKQIETFPWRYGVTAGESLKDLRAFPAHVEKIIALLATSPHRKIHFIGMGGGSVTDFVGFLASIFKRGTSFEFIPTTWLCAIDSAHGGKNGLNVAGIKNQIGCITLPDRVTIYKDILSANGAAQEQDAMGELVKIAILNAATATPNTTINLSQGIWNTLPHAIHAKLKIAEQDLYETKNIRRALNLGHTLAHVLEPVLEMSHGLAVAMGLRFAYNWSIERELLSVASREQCAQYLTHLPPTPAHALKKISATDAAKYITQDKKITHGDKIDFVFLNDHNQTGVVQAQIQAVTIQEIVSEMHRQRWIDEL